MLDFSEYFTREEDWRISRSRDFEPDCYASHYLITIHNHKKRFQMDFYSGFFNFLGTNGLKTAITYAKRRFHKHLNADDETFSKMEKSVEECKLFKAWKSLYEFLNLRQWNIMLAFLLKTLERQNSEKAVFEKRLNLLCETLNLCDTNKELLRFLFLRNYNESVNALYDGVCHAIKTSSHKISYAVIGLLTNYPEETVLETISKERGLISLNILDGSERAKLDPQNYGHHSL